jgi:hypothetical protein
MEAVELEELGRGPILIQEELAAVVLVEEEKLLPLNRVSQDTAVAVAVLDTLEDVAVTVMEALVRYGLDMLEGKCFQEVIVFTVAEGIHITFLQVQELYIHNMAHFAKIDENNIVIDIVRVPDDQENRGSEYMHEIGFPGRYIQTSYNTYGNTHLYGDIPLRGNYAAIGGIYDPELDVFYSKRPNEDMILNLSTYQWEYPIPVPDNLSYTQIPKWNKQTKSWDILDMKDLLTELPTPQGIQ